MLWFLSSASMPGGCAEFGDGGDWATQAGRVQCPQLDGGPFARYLRPSWTVMGPNETGAPKTARRQTRRRRGIHSLNPTLESRFEAGRLAQPGQPNFILQLTWMETRQLPAFR